MVLTIIKQYKQENKLFLTVGNISYRSSLGTGLKTKIC